MQDKINQIYFNKLTKTVTKGHCREKQDKANKNNNNNNKRTNQNSGEYVRMRQDTTWQTAG